MYDIIYVQCGKKKKGGGGGVDKRGKKCCIVFFGVQVRKNKELDLDVREE